MRAAFGAGKTAFNLFTGEQTKLMIAEIKEEEMISVPKQVLQSLIWNCELATAGMGKGEESVGRQCCEL